MVVVNILIASGRGGKNRDLNPLDKEGSSPIIIGEQGDLST